MADKQLSIELEGAKKNQRITISAVKGYGRSGATVYLRSGTKVYAELKYTGNDLMGQKTFKLDSDSPLFLDVDMDIDGGKANSKFLANSSKMMDKANAVKCTVWTVAVEDLTDNDYTDLVVNVIATNKY